MVGFSTALLVGIGVLTAIQAGIVGRFVACLRRFRRGDDADEWLPRAGVVLALRGCDPFVTDLLRGLLRLDYPDFVIRIILDDDTGEARSLIEGMTAELGAENVTIDALRTPSARCTLKCSAMRQAVADLQSECEVIAFIDGDVVPHGAWLRDLVRPLRDPAVGASTGHRWYMPREANWGSLVRYFWNAGAVVQMWFNGMTWGGSMAMRVEVIRRIDLLSAWGRALSVDCTVCRQIRRHGYRVEFVPGVIAVNRERISLSRFLPWVRRQLMAAKTPWRNWAVVLIHGGLLTLVQFVALGLAVVGLATGEGWLAAINAVSLLLLWGANLVMAAWLEHGMRRIARGNGHYQRWLSAEAVVRLFPAFLLTLAAYPVELVRASFCRRVEWRGIAYEVDGPSQVRMIAYRPFGRREGSDSTTSLV